MGSDVLEILEKYKTHTFEDEDGFDISISLNEGASAEDVRDFEGNKHIQMPDELRSLFLYSDGLDFFGVEIMSLAEMEYSKEAGVLTFHNWGNGDFDCIAIKSSSYETGSVLFMNHSVERLYRVTSTFTQWISSVVQEIESKGALLHPGDYLGNDDEDGLYKSVFIELLQNKGELS